MSETTHIAALFIELITVSESMLEAAKTSDWDQLTKLDLIRYQHLELLSTTNGGLDTEKDHQQRNTLIRLDEDIRKAVENSRLQLASDMKQTKKNRYNINQYVEGSSLPTP